MDKDFWKNKKVLITGHTGFKGAWLSLWLHKLGAIIIGYSNGMPFTPNLYQVPDVSKRIRNYLYDIKDLHNIKNVINIVSPDIIFHMAAQSLVRTSYKFPIETFNVNIIGTVNILEAIRYSDSTKACVVVTSDKCYENKELNTPFKETDPMGGHDPYSASKGCAELVTSSYKKSFLQDKGVATVRAGNVIGGGDWNKDRLIPDIIRSLIKNKKPIIRNPNAIRPWQHVLEPLRGYMMLAENLYNDKDKFSEGWNFGPDYNEVKTVQEITQKMFKLWGVKSDWQQDQKEDNPHEANYLRLDCSNTINNLNWKPILNVDDSLKYTVDWYKNFVYNSNMYEYTIKQIIEYEELLKENGYVY